MGFNVTAVIVIGLILCAILFWLVKRRRAAQESALQDRQQNFQEANRLLKEINKSLGFPEGTGPTGIVVDGKYHIVNVGHTERMKNDPVYAFGDEMARILMEMNDLENALKEAQASHNIALARAINKELQVLEGKANVLMDKRQREHRSG
jgi:hypothetical protein